MEKQSIYVVFHLSRPSVFWFFLFFAFHKVCNLILTLVFCHCRVQYGPHPSFSLDLYYLHFVCISVHFFKFLIRSSTPHKKLESFLPSKNCSTIISIFIFFLYLPVFFTVLTSCIRVNHLLTSPLFSGFYRRPV